MQSQIWFRNPGTFSGVGSHPCTVQLKPRKVLGLRAESRWWSSVSPAPISIGRERHLWWTSTWDICFEPKPLSMQMVVWQLEWQSWTTHTLCESTARPARTSLKRPSILCTDYASPALLRGCPSLTLGRLVSSRDFQGLHGRANAGYLPPPPPARNFPFWEPKKLCFP